MARDSKDLAPILVAIGRQIAGRKAGSTRSSRPERDLPILLLPHERPGQAAGDRGRGGKALPYLMTPTLAPEPAAPAAEPPAVVLPSRPQRNEGAFLRLDPDLGGTPA